MNARDYKAICFVVMPFGSKPVGRRKVPFLPLWRSSTVDFDKVYREVFKPAIESVSLPEGGKLVPRRADEDLYAGVVSEDMFAYLEYSRMVLADISSENANVFYELGVRHRAREVGTAIFRQIDASIPFDINQVRSLPYEYQPEDRAAQSRALVTNVLRQSLEQLKNDSPVQLAIGRQRQKTENTPALELLLRSAEESLLQRDAAAAAARYEDAVRDYDAGPLVRQRLAILYRDQGAWDRAVTQLEAIIAEMPGYGSAHRELGIAQNKKYHATAQHARTGLPSGEAELRKAIELSSTDYDAHASLGGMLRREGRFQEAVAIYRKATELSLGHPYPLLNEIKLQARADGKLVLDEQRRDQLKGAARLRLAQTNDKPPADAPWCFFDLAEIRFYQGDYDALGDLVRKGIDTSTADWQPKTFADALAPLLETDLGSLDKDRLASARDMLLSRS